MTVPVTRLKRRNKRTTHVLKEQRYCTINERNPWQIERVFELFLYMVKKNWKDIFHMEQIKNETAENYTFYKTYPYAIAIGRVFYRSVNV